MTTSGRWAIRDRAAAARSFTTSASEVRLRAAQDHADGDAAGKAPRAERRVHEEARRENAPWDVLCVGGAAAQPRDYREDDSGRKEADRRGADRRAAPARGRTGESVG